MENEEMTKENFKISIEQVCAAILSHNGHITIPISVLFENFEGKQIALSQNNEDMTLTLSLVASEMIDDLVMDSKEKTWDELPTYEEFSQKSE